MDLYSDLVLVVKPVTTTDTAATASNGTESTSPSPASVSYRVHRSKLGRNSMFFDRLFRGNFREQQEAKDRVEIELDPSIAQHFDTVLEFLYNKDKIRIKRFDIKRPGDTFSFGSVSATEEADPTIITVGMLIPLAQAAKFLLIPALYDLILDDFKTGYSDICFFSWESSDEVFPLLFRDLCSWSLAKVLGMADIEEQILSNLMTAQTELFLYGRLNTFHNNFISKFPEKYHLQVNQRAEMFEDILNYMEKMYNNKHIDFAWCQWRSIYGMAFATIFVLPEEAVTKSMFDKVVMSPVAVVGYDEEEDVEEDDHIVCHLRDDEDKFSDEACNTVVSMMLLHERFYPSESMSGDIKLTFMEAKLIKLINRILTSDGESSDVQNIANAKTMSRLPNHILSVIAMSQVVKNGENLIDQLVVEEENK